MDEQLTLNIANEIYESGLVEFSHPDLIGYNWMDSGTNDSLYGSQWNLIKISAPDAWNISIGSPSIIIAILDNGVQSNHPDLDGHLVTGYDVVDNDYTTDPYNSTFDYHGTACAGVAAAETNNGIGIAGVGYNCKIMPIQFTHNDLWTDYEKLAAGINWAAAHGADIINISGSTFDQAVVTNAIANAVSNGRNGKGCIIVKSAGNDGYTDDHEISFPGKDPNVICVGATDQNDARNGISSYGRELDVMAPSGVYATSRTGYISNFQNTSSAAPHVAGLAGLILALNNNLTEAQVRKIICYTADDINSPGFDDETGWGRINAWRALDAISNVTTNGALPRDQIWLTTVNLTGNVTVPSGVKLTIVSGATVNLTNGNNRYSIISTGGIITKEVGATINGLRATLTANLDLKGLCSTTQVAANYANFQYNEIYLENGNYNENVSISNKDQLRIQGGSSEYSHFGQLTLTNCDEFEGLYFGAKSVYINYGSYVILSGVNAYGTDQSTIGFSLYNSDTYYVYNLIAAYSQAGILCSDGTEADIDESYLYDNLQGLRSYNGSNVDISNTYFCGTGLDLKTYNFSSIDAGLCFFDGGTPSVSGSNIQHYGDQSCPLSKAASNQQTGNNNYVISTDDNNTAGSEFEKINSAYFSLNKKLINAFKEKATLDKEATCAEYEKVIADFKEFIENNPDSPLAKIALIASAKSYRRIDNLREKSDFAEMKNFLTGIIENKEYPALIPQAERLMIDYYRLTNDYTEAIKTADNIIEKYQKDTNYVCGALYAKGLIQAHSLNQSEKAIECFSLILQEYPGNGLAVLAENELGLLGVDASKIAKEKPTADNNPGFSTSSYPNPFNPTTIINYTLPDNERVVIKVYDILGREVKELVNEQKAAGTYSVEFDGSKLSSGVYFYTITAGQFSQTKKMVLAK